MSLRRYLHFFLFFLFLLKKSFGIAKFCACSDKKTKKFRKYLNAERPNNNRFPFQTILRKEMRIYEERPEGDKKTHKRIAGMIFQDLVYLLVSV